MVVFLTAKRASILSSLLFSLSKISHLFQCTIVLVFITSLLLLSFLSWQSVSFFPPL